MIIRITVLALSFALACVALAAPRIAAPQAATPKAKPAPDPELVDAQGFRKIVEQYKGPPLLSNLRATWWHA